MSKTDENREYLALADNGSIAEPLRVDPVTGRLLIEIFYKPEIARTLNRTKIDENYEPAVKAVDDDGEIVPLLIDSRNGYLLVDIINE
jgi:hypothetical protein